MQNGYLPWRTMLTVLLPMQKAKCIGKQVVYCWHCSHDSSYVMCI